MGEIVPKERGGYLVFPERGQVRITEKGINHASNLKIADVVASSTISEIVKLDNQREIIRPRVKNLIKTESPQDLIDTGFNQIEFQVKSELLEKLRSVDPYYFEKVVLILLKKMGYGDFIETPKSADGGVDGVINEDELGLDKIYIQAKRFNENKVREKDIRNFIGAMSGDTNKGVFVTTSSFDDGAIKKANNAHHKIILIDGNKLVELMHKFNVGVQVNSVYEVKGLDEDFFEGQ